MDAGKTGGGLAGMATGAAGLVAGSVCPNETPAKMIGFLLAMASAGVAG
jgi:hypothetical protein